MSTAYGPERSIHGCVLVVPSVLLTGHGSSSVREGHIQPGAVVQHMTYLPTHFKLIHSLQLLQSMHSIWLSRVNHCLSLLAPLCSWPCSVIDGWMTCKCGLLSESSGSIVNEIFMKAAA